MKLNKQGKKEVKEIMDLALSWLSSWDVVGEGKSKEPEKRRVEAMHQLKDAVTKLAFKAQNKCLIAR